MIPVLLAASSVVLAAASDGMDDDRAFPREWGSEIREIARSVYDAHYPTPPPAKELESTIHEIEEISRALDAKIRVLRNEGDIETADSAEPAARAVEGLLEAMKQAPWRGTPDESRLENMRRLADLVKWAFDLPGLVGFVPVREGLGVPGVRMMTSDRTLLLHASKLETLYGAPLKWGSTDYAFAGPGGWFALCRVKNDTSSTFREYRVLAHDPKKIPPFERWIEANAGHP
jgi:hypothetical protein